MLATAVIVLREVLEAALVVSIVLVATRGVVGRGAWISYGIVAGTLGALAVAAFADVISAAASGLGQEIFNATVLFIAVAMLREGSELVLFLYGIASAGPGQTSELGGGFALGLAAGLMLAVGMYFGLLRVPAKHLFAVTGWLILLLAAGMAAQGAAYLVQADILPPLGET